MKVRVHWNLRIGGWTIQHYVPRKGWRVWGHRQSLVLRGVEWRVYEAGRQRTIRTRRKNVHAFAVGRLDLQGLGDHEGHNLTDVRYNPYKGPTFWQEGASAEPVEVAVFYSNRRILAGPREREREREGGLFPDPRCTYCKEQYPVCTPHDPYGLRCRTHNCPRSACEQMGLDDLETEHQLFLEPPKG